MRALRRPSQILHGGVDASPVGALGGRCRPNLRARRIAYYSNSTNRRVAAAELATQSTAVGAAVHGQQPGRKSFGCRWRGRVFPGSSPAPEGLQERQSLSHYCTWAIGGPARYLVRVKDIPTLSTALRWATGEGLAVWVVGRGSNCLFDDRGFDGLVIINDIQFIEERGDGVFRCGSGCQFNKFGLHTASRGWSGLEFACGIPGTLGGAVYMNSGADGQETSQTLTSAEVMHADGSVETWRWDQAAGKSGFGYRQSPFQQLPKSSVLVAATYSLRRDPYADTRARNSLARRKATQPLASKSAGCVFRNPSGGPGQRMIPAGLLIEQLGMKGASEGGAVVSPQHANFLINEGECSSDDMRRLIARVKNRVAAEVGIVLQEEICVVPFSAPPHYSTLRAAKGRAGSA